MKYEEWIEYERARLDEKRRLVVERLQREEALRRDNQDQQPKANYHGPIPPKPPSLGA